MMKRIFVVTLALVLGACVYPTTQTQVVDDRPTVSVEGAPEGSSLLVDGLVIGAASEYAPTKRAVRLQPGTHVVRVEKGGMILMEEKVFLSGGMFKVFKVEGK